MRAWHFSGALLLAMVTVTPGWSQTCTLAEIIKPGDCFQYGITMKLTGEIRFQKDNGTVPVKLTASAGHAFPERVLTADGPIIQKAARIYENAKVAIDRGNDRSECMLRPSRKLIVAQRQKDQALAYSPAGALYRNELELISDHFDTLALPALLPGKALKVGETWKVTNVVAQALSSLEGMTENKLEGKLTAITGDVATFTVTGTAAGVEGGAQVKLTVEASGSYAVKAGRITNLTWKQKSERDQGPISPASSMEITVTLNRKAIQQPMELADVALVSVPDGFTPPGPMTNLEFRDAQGRFALIHTRDWHLTAVTKDHTVLRLIDRGDYVAQVTVTQWTPAKKGEHLTPDQFRKAVNETSGWKVEKELQAGEIKSEGRFVYRISAQGFLDGVSVLQNFYLIAAPNGEQVVMTFTLSPKQAEKLGARDLSMAASIEVPAAPAK